MSWVVGVICFCVGFGVCYGFMKKRKGAQITQIRTDDLKGNERRVYDLLVKGDGVGYFAKSCEELGISKKEMEEVVGGLVKRGLVRDRKFSYQRKLYLVDFLNELERRVLDFLRKEGGEAEVAEIMKRVGTEDHRLIPMGKKFVRMGLIRKIRRGYKTFFVLVED